MRCTRPVCTGCKPGLDLGWREGDFFDINRGVVVYGRRGIEWLVFFFVAFGGGFLVVGLWFLGLAPKRIGGVELHFHEPLMERWVFGEVGVLTIINL